MTVVWTCDFCGQKIYDRQEMMTIQSSGSAWVAGWIGHYHAGPGDGSCYEQFLGLVGMAREHAGNLAAIPVAKQRDIDALRAQHRDSALTTARERFIALGVPKPAVGALVRAGVLDLWDVRRRSDETLLAIEGVGVKAVEILRKAASDAARARAEEVIREAREAEA